MGLWNWVKNTAKAVWNGARGAYEEVKEYAKTGWGYVKQGWGAVKSFADNIDHALQWLEGVPMIGDVATIVRENPLYGEIFGTINTIDHGMEIVEQVGKDTDELIEKGMDIVGFPGEGESLKHQSGGERDFKRPPTVIPPIGGGGSTADGAPPSRFLPRPIETAPVDSVGVPV